MVHEPYAEDMHRRQAAIDRSRPLPNSESALLKALEKIIAEVSERRVGHREKIAEIARTAIDQARE